jgi:hypothetical protein
MEWQIKPLSRQSAVSGAPFEPGETAVCLLLAGDDGEVQRVDLRPAEVETYAADSTVLGRWQRTVRAATETGKQAEAARAASAEELFLSLCQNTARGAEGDALLQAVAIVLERKRILRGPARASEGQRTVLHAPTKTEYTIPWAEWEPRELFEAVDRLQQLLAD